MGHLLTTFYWSTSSFTGAGQLNEGPFHVGTLNKLFRAEVRGAMNYQGASNGSHGVLANFPAWGLQQVPHGAAALDVITSTDDDTWLMRRQTGSEDILTAWAPDSAIGTLFASNGIEDDWHGQLAVGADTDLYLSLKSSTGAGVNNFNTFGTIRIWWA